MNVYEREVRPMVTEPLCGREWLRKHWNKHTQAEIDSLSIVISHCGKNLPPIRQDTKGRGIVKDLVKSYRKEVRA